MSPTPRLRRPRAAAGPSPSSRGPARRRRARTQALVGLAARAAVHEEDPVARGRGRSRRGIDRDGVGADSSRTRSSVERSAARRRRSRSSWSWRRRCRAETASGKGAGAAAGRPAAAHAAARQRESCRDEARVGVRERLVDRALAVQARAGVEPRGRRADREHRRHVLGGQNDLFDRRLDARRAREGREPADVAPPPLAEPARAGASRSVGPLERAGSAGRSPPRRARARRGPAPRARRRRCRPGSFPPRRRGRPAARSPCRAPWSRRPGRGGRRRASSSETRAAFSQRGGRGALRLAELPLDAAALLAPQRSEELLARGDPVAIGLRSIASRPPCTTKAALLSRARRRRPRSPARCPRARGAGRSRAWRRSDCELPKTKAVFGRDGIHENDRIPLAPVRPPVELESARLEHDRKRRQRAPAGTPAPAGLPDEPLPSPAGTGADSAESLDLDSAALGPARDPLEIGTEREPFRQPQDDAARLGRGGGLGSEAEKQGRGPASASLRAPGPGAASRTRFLQLHALPHDCPADDRRGGRAA